MDIHSINMQLEGEWALPNGFLALLRQGQYDPVGFQRLMAILEAAARTLETDNSLDRRFVALVWFIPLFISWQRERVQERGGKPDDVDAAFHRVLDLLYSLLGLP